MVPLTDRACHFGIPVFAAPAGHVGGLGTGGFSHPLPRPKRAARAGGRGLQAEVAARPVVARKHLESAGRVWSFCLGGLVGGWWQGGGGGGGEFVLIGVYLFWLGASVVDVRLGRLGFVFAASGFGGRL